MNGTVLVAAVCGLLASADAAEWEDPAVNSIGRLPPRTWSVPLAKESDAFTDELEYPSPFVKSLNGVWGFKWKHTVDYPNWEDPVPSTFDWDLWLGPAEKRPFADQWPENCPYPGMACANWDSRHLPSAMSPGIIRSLTS